MNKAGVGRKAGLRDRVMLRCQRAASFYYCLLSSGHILHSIGWLAERHHVSSAAIQRMPGADWCQFAWRAGSIGAHLQLVWPSLIGWSGNSVPESDRASHAPLPRGLASTADRGRRWGSTTQVV
ncbi:unnamed protein product [Protopolystoma xenopodis]|uniref:Uncharacterized protein n=1 Tax=Protopolystoma xenopodis TaxID=117903 RepID=A0A3S5C0W0_9PLAT|nr:unnamed protein product [Protopolystoma xenopodis]